MTDEVHPLERLRPEVLRRTREDGGLDLFDLLTDRLVRLSPREVRGLSRRDPLALMRLEQAFVFEDSGADALRERAWAARAFARPAVPRAEAAAAFDWDRAAELPAGVAPTWRDPEAWRRLAEDRAAGRRYLTLRGLLTADAAHALGEEARALAFVRLETDLVRADRRLLGTDDLPAWRAFMTDEATRALFGAVLGRRLPSGLIVNAWRLGAGDFMGVHPDGHRYHGTLSLGLCAGWTAADGGAIAFGEPRAGGFATAERWLPHAGDACVFAPAADTWHAVEPVAHRTRHSVTGWWVDPADVLS